MDDRFCTVEEALDELRAGRIIISIDDPDRENEGDMICAAEFATTENVNFMAKYAKGLICTPMSEEIAASLGLEQMVKVNTDNHCTALPCPSTTWTPVRASRPKSAATPAASAWTPTQSRRTSAARATCSR